MFTSFVVIVIDHNLCYCISLLELAILQCSKTCGTGSLFRRIECRVKSSIRRVNHSAGAEPTVQSRMCIGLPRPPLSQQCVMNPCDAKYRWSVGPWSQVIVPSFWIRSLEFLIFISCIRDFPLPPSCIFQFFFLFVKVYFWDHILLIVSFFKARH